MRFKMNLSENYFIFSVFQSNQDDSINFLNHQFMKATLERQAVRFIEATGAYNGDKEMCFIVFGLSNEDLVKGYSQTFNQESYLMVHNDRTAELKFKDKVIRIGQMHKVKDIKDLQSYVITNNGYYSAF